MVTNKAGLLPVPYKTHHKSSYLEYVRQELYKGKDAKLSKYKRMQKFNAVFEHSQSDVLIRDISKLPDYMRYNIMSKRDSVKQWHRYTSRKKIYHRMSRLKAVRTE